MESATKHGLSSFIPCHNGLHCITMDLRYAAIPSNYTMSNISLIAGHFSWGIWDQFPSYATHTTGQTADKTPPACFVMGRHPVERAISYYYQRCFQISDCRLGYGVRLNDLPAENVRDFIISDRQGESRNPDDASEPIFVLDEGMSDAGCRALGNFKQTTGKIVGRDDISIPPSLTAEQMDIALGNVQHCVVGLQERWKDTKEVLKHWFPWIDMTLGDDERRKMHLFSNKETIETLRLDIRAAIEEENRCDLRLHQLMASKFEKQMQVVRADVFT